MRVLHLLVLIALAACSTPAGTLQISDAWARPSTAAAMQDPATSHDDHGVAGLNGAAYLTLRGGRTPDRLLAADTPVAAAVELHAAIDDAGVMRMRPVEAIEIPAGGEVRLQPGGLHLMLIGLNQPLTAGTSFEIALTFEQAGRRVATVMVRDP
ncbi:MAG TPA: copper chaperone PCu(A)C [Roseiflexaceae bacterium]|nr:copper chaperone PCu(A)C [Roseiflexaceae bacterium]